MSYCRTLGLAVLVLAAACGGGRDATSIEPPPGRPGLTVVATGNVTDTVLAAPVQALVVEVRGPTGAIAPGTAVQFAAQTANNAARPYEVGTFVCAVASPCGPTALNPPTLFPAPYPFPSPNATVDTTDGSGRAKATVRLGSLVGPTYVVVSVPAFGFRDSVLYTVQPGAPHAVRFSVRELSLMLGATAPLRATVRDVFGNPRPEATTFAYAGPDGTATIDAGAATITGRASGFGLAYARYAALADTIPVRVVPPGRFVVWDHIGHTVTLIGVDGSAARVLASDVASDYGAFPRFTPSGGSVVFHTGASQNGGAPVRIVVIDTTGANRREIALPDGLANVTHPRALADGTILFVGRRPSIQLGGPVLPASLYRVTPAGVVTELFALPDAASLSGGVDIAPDGLRVAFVTADAMGSLTGLRVLTVATGLVAVIDSAGQAPRWSTAGDRLAFLTASAGASGGTLVTCNADGSGRQTLIAAGTFVIGGALAWSPDGAYLVGAGTDPFEGLRMVAARDGTRLTLGLPAGVGLTFPDAAWQPDWR